MSSNYNKKTIILIITSFLLGQIFMIMLIRFTPILGNFSGSNNMITNKTKIYEKSSLAESVNKAKDSVVLVQGYSYSRVNSAGSGFVYKVDDNYGYIITNEHVLADDDIRVTFTDEKEAKATVLGKDEYLDLAVLRVEKKYVSSVAQIGNSEDMNIGDIVFAIGAPLGYEYMGSVTSGVLSGKNRAVKTTVSNTNNEWIMKVIQTDASINHGNSGGPLLNINGEVIGICTMKLTESDIEGMGFAIPIEYALNYVDSLEKGEQIKWPTLGIKIANTTDSGKIARANITIPNGIYDGVVVLEINDKSIVSNSLKIGDVITKINDKKVDDIAHFKYELYQYRAGDKVKITYNRSGKEKHSEIILGSE